MSIIASGKKYKGFDIISNSDIPDCNSKGIYLRHRKTGLEVFHLLNNDEENLFAFTFRTPPDDSTGAAHILEHSVLCGSEKYPLKDTFIRLANQSVKTYLNALTFPDKTVFPGSSMIHTDYFNLMSVYGDAVFFPQLSPEIFLQEAHRLEINKDDTCSIQGVVYNEMKGNYSSFDSVASSASVRSLFPGTAYAFDSGGDPLIIPSIRYEQLKAFHKKYYRCDNCLVFLYGNISTAKQLDFLQEKFLDRIEQTDRESDKSENLQTIIRRETVTPFANPVFVEEKGPSSDKKDPGATVTANWLLGDTDKILHYMECVFLSEILCGHDGSPLRKALLDSGLGEDIAPNTGLLTDMRSMVMTIGLRGVEQKNIKEVERLIFRVLNNLCETGIPQSDIDSAIMSVSFANREITRAGGPYSLVLMLRALRGWTYGTEPARTLGVQTAFNDIQKYIETDPGYITGLIQKLFLDNKHRSLVSVTPDASYSRERNDFEQKLVSDAAAQTTRESIHATMDKLHSFQQSSEADSQPDCLPHIKPADLDIQPDCVKTEITTCRAGDNHSVTLFLNREHTNGIVYIDVAFPVDILSPEEYPYLPLFSIAATNSGWNDKSWADTAGLIATTCGGFGAMLLTSTEDERNGHSLPYTGRDWIIFRMKMPVEKSETALNLLTDCLNGTMYNDTKRLQDLANEYRNDFDEAIIPSGHAFAASRAACTVNHEKAVDEIWNGISQLFTAHKLAETDMTVLGHRFTDIGQNLKNGGAIIHIATDSEYMPGILKLVPDFIRKNDLRPLQHRRGKTDEKLFYQLTTIPSKQTGSEENTEICIVPAQVGFAASVFQASPWGQKAVAAELVLSHWLSGTLLWEQLRTIGGAYGAAASVDALEKLCTFITYRDPSPLTSPEILVKCLKQTAEAQLDTITVEKAVTGTYSHEIQPRSPANRCFSGFLRCLYSITDHDRKQKVKWILSVTSDDLKSAAERLYQNSLHRKTAIICNQNSDLKGKLTVLPV